MAIEQTVARPCVEKRSRVAERRTESELSRGEERKTAEFTKARQDDRSILVQVPILSEINCF